MFLLLKKKKDYEIYELTTKFSDYQSSSGQFFKETKTELAIICKSTDCQDSILAKRGIFYGRTAQGGNPDTKILASKKIF